MILSLLKFQFCYVSYRLISENENALYLNLNPNILIEVYTKKLGSSFAHKG